ncbi:MAG: sugar transporter [Moraxellaceae bacterium]|nr:sugar transporter [Moraxellaceae bacterium]
MHAAPSPADSVVPVPAVPTTPQETGNAWWRVIALALAAFIFNTTEFVPVGLLTDIAASFGMQTARTGLMITIYAWVVTLASLPVMLLTRDIERKKLLVATFIVFIASHLLSGVAWNFTVLMISRLGVALAHAVFWSITVSLAVRIAPVGKRAQALSLLSTGSVLAMVIGVPMGRVLGQHLGWRITFLAIAVLAVLTLIALLRLLPKLPSQHAGSLDMLPRLLRRTALTRLYVLTAVIVTAHFTAYSYIEPFLQDVIGLHGGTVTMFLLVLGGAGVLGSLVFSRWGGRQPSLLITPAVMVLTLSTLALALAASTQPTLVALGLVWGMSIMVIGIGLQAKVLEAAPDATDLAMSLFSGIYNIGIGGGALLGSQVSVHLGMGDIGYVASAIGLVALLWCLLVFRRDICLRARVNRQLQAFGRGLAALRA